MSITITIIWTLRLYITITNTITWLSITIIITSVFIVIIYILLLPWNDYYYYCLLLLLYVCKSLIFSHFHFKWAPCILYQELRLYILHTYTKCFLRRLFISIAVFFSLSKVWGEHHATALCRKHCILVHLTKSWIYLFFPGSCCATCERVWVSTYSCCRWWCQWCQYDTNG